MKTIKLFIWFTKHSRQYMAGDKRFYTGFIKAWIEFYRLSKAGL